jgi:hypothetical protein
MARMQVHTRLILLSIVLAGLLGCGRQSTSPAVLPTPTLAPGWDRYTHPGQCSYGIDHPSNMDITSQGTYSRILSSPSTEPGGSVPNFIYISVIPDDFTTGGDGSIYNYDPGETQTLLDLQVGQSWSLREDPTLADWFTYTRLPDVALSKMPVQAYENTQPWEFPPGTEEIRYYLKADGCTYLIGGYLATVGSGQPGWMDEELFYQIISTFRLSP